MKTRIFQKIPSDDLSGYDLMSDMLGSYQKQCGENRHDSLKIKFRGCKVGKSKKRRFSYLGKIQKSACPCCHISCNDRDQDRNNRKKTTEQDLPEYRNSKCHQKYNHILRIYLVIQKSCRACRISRKFQTDQCNYRSHCRGRKHDIDPVRSTLTDNKRHAHTCDTKYDETAKGILITVLADDQKCR